MRKSLLENKIAYVATVSLFTAALAWNLFHGGSSTVPGHMLLPLERPEAEFVAHGPTIPPDPWEGVQVAHGPTIPPDPWEGVRVTHGPTIPPDPWEGVRVTHGPTIPPDPWEGISLAV
jgi:hypothetical protein